MKDQRKFVMLRCTSGTESPRAIDTEPRRELSLLDAAVQTRHAPSHPGHALPLSPPFSTPRCKVLGILPWLTLAIRRLGDSCMGLWNRKYLHNFVAPGRLLSVDISISFLIVRLTFEHRHSIEAGRKRNVEIGRDQAMQI